jgi:hypothetical protein
MIFILLPQIPQICVYPRPKTISSSSKKSHGLLPMAFRMIEGTDKNQGIPKAMGGPGFLPNLAPSLIKVPIQRTPNKGKWYLFSVLKRNAEFH